VQFGSDRTTSRRKGNSADLKARPSRPLAETTMTLSWIARGLKMGAASSLANCLRANLK
jgi:hypothetical protein